MSAVATESNNLDATQRRALEEQLVELRSYDLLTKRMTQLFLKEIKRMMPELDDEQFNKAFRTEIKEVKKRFSKLYRFPLTMYSDKELIEMLELYRSDAGRRMLELELSFNYLAVDYAYLVGADINDLFIKKIQEIQSSANVR